MEDFPSLPMLPFATLGFRDPDAVPAFHRFECTASAKLAFDVQFCCDSNGLSGENFGLAALQILLIQLTGTDDFVIGLGRTTKGKGDIMPVRFKGDLQHTSEQLLEQTKATMELCRLYLNEPAKNLLCELSISSQTLLHQVTFGWIANAYATTETTDMYFEHAQDLIVVVREDGDGNLVIFVGLHKKTYDEEHGKVVADMYIRAMEQLVARSTTSIGDMDLINPAERKTSMERGSGPLLGDSSNSVLEKLQDVTTATPNQVAVKDERGHTMTYIELIRRAIAMSSDLKKHGVTRGIPVCVIGPPTIDLLCSVLAIWCAGGTYVPIDHGLSVDDNLTIAKLGNTDHCVVSLPNLVEYGFNLQLGTVFYCGDMVYTAGFDEVEEPLPQDVAVRLHVPLPGDKSKSVILTHGNLHMLVAATAYYFDDKPIVLQHSNWTSDLSLFQILLALTSGGTLILAVHPDAVNVANTMAQQETTITIATPSEYSSWFQQSFDVLKFCKSWKYALTIGENLPSSVIRNFTKLQHNDLEVANLYGTTETTIACCMGWVVYKEYSADKHGIIIPAGIALPNYQVWVGDHLGRPLPPAWTGDIWVAGPGIAAGYFGSEDDENRFRVHPETGTRCFRTGDWGFIIDTGELVVVSRRLDESVARIHGFYVELGDISRTIVNEANGRVAEAVVVSKSDNEQQEPHVQAFVVMNEVPNLESRRYLQALLLDLNLPAYMRPTRAVIRRELPRTSGGRIDRHALMAISIPDAEIIQVMPPASPSMSES
jgi:acyl-CoA synthetase (AMP-forming)/AMP-acid ligase II